MTKQEFLDRCATAYDMGLCSDKIIRHISKAYDALHRLEGDQFHYFVDYLVDERQRTDHFSNHKQLANDQLGYDGIRLLAIFTHHCQICATDKDAWHTRAGFCPHKGIFSRKEQ
jgi:hypothetical protein